MRPLVGFLWAAGGANQRARGRTRWHGGFGGIVRFEQALTGRASQPKNPSKTPSVL
jgi:hypothetical protein